MGSYKDEYDLHKLFNRKMPFVSQSEINKESYCNTEAE